jgi:hypothetical protein
MNRRLGFPLALILAAAIAGCGDDHDHDHEEELTAEEEACEHLSEGPFQAVTAVADPSEGLPNIAIEHTSVTVALVEDEGSYSGLVAFESGADADYVLFLDTNVPLVVFDGAGVEVPIEHTHGGSDVCTDIALSHTVELEVGTYTFDFGPTDVAELNVVHEAAGGHDHAEHE